MHRVTIKPFVISTQANGPWNRPDTKHRMIESLAVPSGARNADFSPYRAVTPGGYLPMSRAYGDHPRRSEPVYGQRKPEKDVPDHKLNPYRFAKDKMKAITESGEPYVHPTFGFLADWGSEPYRHAYAGAHSVGVTSKLTTTRYSDTAAAALGKDRPLTPATIARMATTNRVANLNRPQTAASSDRRTGAPAAAPEAAAGAGAGGGGAAAGGAPGVTPSSGQRPRPRPRSAPQPRPVWTKWPETAHRLRETSTLLRPPHTSRAAQIAAVQYPQVYGRSGSRAATSKEQRENAAASTLQAGYRGARVHTNSPTYTDVSKVVW